MPRTEANPAIRSHSALFVSVVVCGALALSLAVGTTWHEVVGHGFVGWLCGGSVEYVEILGLQVYPRPQWVGWPFGPFLGRCTVTGVPSEARENLMNLGGSLSTWCVALFATCVLRFWRRRGWSLAVLALLSIWWIDILSYTLPLWGIKHFVFWGGNYPEPYAAAKALGCPGWLFLVVVIGGSAGMAVNTLAKLRSLCWATADSDRKPN